MGTKNNNLLKENTIRRFMKLANVQSLTDNFISENLEEEETNEQMGQVTRGDGPAKPIDPPMKSGKKGDDEDDGQLEEQMDMDEEPEMDMDEEPEMDMGEEPEMDMGDDMGDEEPGAADISLTEEEAELLISLGERLSQAMEDELGGEEDDMGMDDDMDMEDDLEGDMGEDPAADLEDEEPGMGIYENKDAIIQEVLKRVTRRVLKARR